MPKVPKAKFLGSDVLFCFIGICKFGNFKHPFTMITSLLNFTLDSAGVEISYFCQTNHFWCGQKSYCSSPITTKGFGGALSPLFDPAFTGSFPISAIKKYLICWKSIFSHLFFFSENTVIHCHLVCNTFKIQSRTTFTFSQSNYSKRLLNVVTHKHYKI